MNFSFSLVRIEARIVDAAWSIAVRPSVIQSATSLPMPGPSLTQMATAYHRPRTFWLSPIDGPPSAVTCSRPLKEWPLVVAELAEDRRQLHGALERLEDLLHVEVALRGRQPRLVLLEDVARMAEARIGLLVIAPFDLAAFGGARVAGVAHIGRVALVAQQRPADLLAGAGELVIGAEEGRADGRPA